MFDLLIHLDLESQGHRSKFTVTRWLVFFFQPLMHITRWLKHSASPGDSTKRTRNIYVI